jgi:hypothetical protein
MTRAGVLVGVGTRFVYDGQIIEIVELHTLDGSPEVLAKHFRAQTVRRFALAELMYSDRSRLLSDDLSVEAVDSSADIPSVVWSAAPKAARRQARDHAAHVPSWLSVGSDGPMVTSGGRGLRGRLRERPCDARAFLPEWPEPPASFAGWMHDHRRDPYRQPGRLGHSRPLAASDTPR